MQNSKLFHSQALLLYIYMLTIAILLYCRDVLDMSISKDFFIVIGLIFSISVKYDILISIILYTLPLLSGLPGNYFLPVWCILVLFHQKRRRSLNYTSLLLWGIICIWEIILYGFYTYTVPTMNVVGYFSVLMLSCILIAETRPIYNKQALLAFCIGCSVFLGVIIIMYINNPMLIETGKRLGGDAYIDNLGLTLKANANVVGYYSIVLAAFSLVLLYYKKILLSVFIVFFIVAFVSGIYSVSRMWAIMMFVLVVLFLIFNKINKKISYYLIISLVLFGGFYLYKNPSILETFIIRFTDESISTGGGRTKLFEMYNEFLLNNWGNMLFGTSAMLYKEVTGIHQSIHNGTQQIMVCYGLLGFCLIICSVTRMFRKHYIRSEYMCLIPFIIIIFFLQSIQVINPYNGIYPIIAAFFMMKMIKGDKQA